MWTDTAKVSLAIKMWKRQHLFFQCTIPTRLPASGSAGCRQTATTARPATTGGGGHHQAEAKAARVSEHEADTPRKRGHEGVKMKKKHKKCHKHGHHHCHKHKHRRHGKAGEQRKEGGQKFAIRSPPQGAAAAAAAGPGQENSDDESDEGNTSEEVRGEDFIIDYRLIKSSNLIRIYPHILPQWCTKNCTWI